MDKWLKENIVCPRDKREIELRGDKLVCSMGHTYNLIDGIPIMLLNDVDSTHFMHDKTIQLANDGVSFKAQDEEILSLDCIDPYVQANIASACGHMYHGLIDKVTEYPIPDIPIPDGNGKHLLDIGCNWGRWSISAARKGYNVVGIDHSLFPVRAARRIAKKMNLDAHFLVADARFLPFKPEMFDVIFSFSVIQHLKKEEARIAIAEIPKVMKHDGESVIQMPNVLGLKNLYNQLKYLIKGAEYAGVNFWSLSELEKTFNELVGPTSLSVDAFFSLNVQKTDLRILPRKFHPVVYMSESLKKISGKLPFLIHIADSVYVISKHKV